MQGIEEDSAAPELSNCISLALGEITRKYLEEHLEEKIDLDQKGKKKV